MMSRSTAFLGLPMILALGACSTSEPAGQHWQRTSTSQAVYSEGPKADQVLKQDISRCVVELRELEDLGSVKDAVPTDRQGRVLNPDELEDHRRAQRLKKEALDEDDTEERKRALLAEHKGFTDFEGCMNSKGWTRVKHTPYKIDTKARKSWFQSQFGDDVSDDPRDAPLNPPYDGSKPYNE